FDEFPDLCSLVVHGDSRDSLYKKHYTQNFYAVLCCETCKEDRTIKNNINKYYFDSKTSIICYDSESRNPVVTLRNAGRGCIFAFTILPHSSDINFGVFLNSIDNEVRKRFGSISGSK